MGGEGLRLPEVQGWVARECKKQIPRGNDKKKSTGNGRAADTVVRWQVSVNWRDESLDDCGCVDDGDGLPGGRAGGWR